MDAITSLAKLRPVSQQAGAAIEQATHDDSVRVRLQARTLLWQYHLAGYHGGKTPEVGTPRTPVYTQEPPLAAQPQPREVSVIQKPATSSPTVGYVSPVETPAPQANVWGATISPRTLPAQPAALPMGPKPLPSAPAQEQVLTAPPSPPAPERGATPQPLPAVPDIGPKPLPSGPAKAANNGPKPLPQGPDEIIGKPSAEKTNKESSNPQQKDDGPELP